MTVREFLKTGDKRKKIYSDVKSTVYKGLHRVGI